MPSGPGNDSRPGIDAIGTRCSAVVLTEADQLAAGIVAVLDKLAERIPDLRTPDPATSRRARGARTVSREFIASMIAMFQTSARLQALSKFNEAKARNVLQSATRSASCRSGWRCSWPG
jgi:hypothetical protein